MRDTERKGARPITKKVDDKTLLCMCLTGKTQTAIAKELGMTKVQICKRVNTPEFQALLSDYRKRIIDGVLTDLVAHSQKAVKTLVALLDDKSAFVRLNAACRIISITQDFTVQRDLLADIEKLKSDRM